MTQKSLLGTRLICIIQAISRSGILFLPRRRHLSVGYEGFGDAPQSTARGKALALEFQINIKMHLYGDLRDETLQFQALSEGTKVLKNLTLFGIVLGVCGDLLA